MQNFNLNFLKDKRVITTIYVVEGILFAVAFLLLVARFVDPFSISNYDMSELAAKAAAILFAATLIPGSLQRFKLFPWLYSLAIFYRRTTGILVYLMILFHLAFSTYAFPLFEQLSDNLVLTGLASALLLLPVFVTSNNVSQRLLKRNWKRVQRLTYVTFFVLLLHFFFVGEGEMIIYYVAVGVFVIGSYVYNKLSVPPPKSPSSDEPSPQAPNHA